jgi:hypothetical protein
MAQGLLTVTNVVNFDPGPPNQWTLTVTNSAGVTVGDHVAGELAGGEDALWLVNAVPDGVTVRVIDSLNEGIGGGANEFGTPVVGTVGYATPTSAQVLTLGAEGSPGWRAIQERNWNVIDGLL